MIERYTRPEMGVLWSQEARFKALLEVELAVADAQADLGIIPVAAARDLRTKARVNVEEILRIEETTRHDVIAFVSQVASTVGENGRFLHYAMTSSDVLDTALSVQVLKAAEVLNLSLDRWQSALTKLMRTHAGTLCAGRTHGMHAEPTTFGAKMSGHLTELKRNRARFERAVQQMAVGKLSGAVGTFSSQPPAVEAKVCAKLNLRPEPVATQVIPRDRHAELMWALAMIGGGLERLALELRHLQRTEVGEALEGFGKGQKGSSAMPHKRNPISAENLTGAARLLRAYLQAAMENIALWHERDISHSSVERVALPDAFILADYAADRMGRLLENLDVKPERMLANADLSQGQLFSSHLLLALVQKGLSREAAYALVQELSHSLKPGQQLQQVAALDDRVSKQLSAGEIAEIFSGKSHQPSELLKRAEQTQDGGWLS
ncbi:MAG: adenylosuccinate lyase [Bdellovibrionales bacterium]